MKDESKERGHIKKKTMQEAIKAIETFKPEKKICLNQKSDKHIKSLTNKSFRGLRLTHPFCTWGWTLHSVAFVRLFRSTAVPQIFS